MYTIENLVDDDIIFPFEYGASASEMWSLLLNFPRNRENLEELDQHIRACIAIFVALLCLTVITVAVSYLNLPVPATITLALCVALVKGSLVVSYFMHLVSEKKLILWSLSLTVIFFIILMVIPVVTDLDVISHTITVKH